MGWTAATGSLDAGECLLVQHCGFSPQTGWSLTSWGSMGLAAIPFHSSDSYDKCVDEAVPCQPDMGDLRKI